MHLLRKTVAGLLDQMFPDQLPWDQPTGTAFAMRLTRELGPKNVRNPKLFSAPHSPKTKELLKKLRVPYDPCEWMVDSLLVDVQSKTKHLPLVACESEMYTDHGIDYDFEEDNDYVWDFCKLLHFNAPHKLFFARVNPKRSRMDELEVSLKRCAYDYRTLWSSHRLNIVLFPSGYTRRFLVRLGIGSSNGRVAFESLETKPH